MPDHENILTPPLMLVRYAGMASLLATVWESRRKLQDRNAVLKRQLAEANALLRREGVELDALYDRFYALKKQHLEESVRAQLKHHRDADRIVTLEARLAGGAR